MKKRLNIGIIGFGNMGSAIGEALKKRGLAAGSPLGEAEGRQGKLCLYIYDQDKKKLKNLKGFRKESNICNLIQKSDIVVLAIKPQSLKDFLKEAKTYLLKYRPLLITIAAGVSTKFFQKRLKGIKVIRAMPNIAAKVRNSVTFICKGKFAKKNDLKIAQKIFSCVGLVFLTKESFLDKVTAISGSGPAYLYYFMDSLDEAARNLGFNKKVARQIVTQTFLGAINLIKDDAGDFKVWIKRVASRGGTTEAALKVFEKNKLNNLVKIAVRAAYRRAKAIRLRP